VTKVISQIEFNGVYFNFNAILWGPKGVTF